MAKKMILRLNLQLFADGGAGAASGAGPGADGGTGAGVKAADAAQQSKGVKNPLANVVYGKQPDADATETAGTADASQGTATEQAQADRKAQYERFKAEYKDELDKEKQALVQHRVKGMRETVDRYNKLTPLLEILGKKYGVSSDDADALTKAVEDDDSYYEQEALERGMSVADLKEVRKIERENAMLHRQIEDAERQAQIDRDVQRWMQEAEEAAKVFPGLNLGTELQNPQFVELLKSNIDLQTAYFAVHHRELIPEVQRYTAAQARQQVTNAIRDGQTRPTENGTHDQSAALHKSDVASLTKADRAEIIRRVQRGERISF